MPEIDGIKKYDKQELKKSRKIVLDSVYDEIKKENELIEEKKSNRLIKKRITDIIPRRKIKSLFWGGMNKKKIIPETIKKIQNTDDKVIKTMADIQGSSSKNNVTNIQIEQEKIIPKISQKDKKLWQNEMKDLLAVEISKKTETFELDQKKKEPTKLPSMEQLNVLTVKKFELEQELKTQGEKNNVSERDKENFSDDVKKLSLFSKEKSKDFGQEKTKGEEKKVIDKNNQQKAKGFFSFFKIKKKEKKSSQLSGANKKLIELEKKLVKKEAKKEDKKNSSLITLAPNEITPVLKKKEDRRKKKKKIKIENFDDEFDFNLNTYKRFKQVASKKEIEESELGKEEDEINMVKTNKEKKREGFLKRLFGKKNSEKESLTHTTKEHELSLAAPDLVHDELVAHEEIEKRKIKVKKHLVRNFSAKKFFQNQFDDIRAGWSDCRLYLLTIVIIFITLYSFLLILTLKIEIDTSLTRKIGSYLPIPAVISSNRIIEYYTYKDLQRDYCRGICSVEQKNDFKVWLVNRIILSGLIDRYNLSDTDEGINKLREFVVFDNEVNQVGINRVRKIKSMIDEEGNFYKIAQKFGDQVGQFKIGDIEGVIKDLNVNLSKIENKKTSRIVYGTDGYYLFYLDKELDESTVSYVFVGAKSLEDYLAERLNGYRIWSLVN